MLMGAVVLPCGQLCSRVSGYPPLKLSVSSPAGLLCLPSKAVWIVNREERLWELNGLSLEPGPVALSSERALAFILSDCLFPQVRAAMVAVSVWCVL